MATTITDDCISCGACEPECPNNAIRQADPIYVIDPQLCTECVGFHDYEACAAVCPVDCCVPDPNIVESEEVLIARAKALHQDTNFGENFPSRFRKGDTEQKPPATTPPPSAELALGGAEEPKPVQPAAAAIPGSASNAVSGDGKAPATVKGSSDTAPAGNGEVKPNAAPAEAKRAAAGKPEAGPLPHPNGEVKPVAPAAQPVAAPSVGKDAPKAPPPKAPPKPVERPKKTFPGELPASFQDLAKQYDNKGSGSLSKGLPRLLIILSQPILGALPHDIKKALEIEVQSPLFTAAGSTGLNILHNAVLYPLFAMAFAALVHGPAIIFSQEINIYLLIGIGLALAEGAYRLKDGVVHLKSADDMIFPAALYGVPLGIALRPVLQKRRGVIRDLPIPVDGFSSPGFVEKLERERRYGNVYTIEDRGEAILLKLEFPRRVPDIGLAERSQLPDEMPDYDYDLALIDRQLMIKGRCVDERVRKLSSSIGAFPPEFTTVIPLQEKVVGFGHHFANKRLEVLLVKDKGDQAGRSHR
jgi:hypothetical protein